PVGQLGEPDAGLGGLAFGPLVPIDPDLHRVREIGTDFHKRRPEVIVPEIEVVTGDPPLGLGEREPHSRGLPGALSRQKHWGELLGDPDRGHPARPVAACRAKYGRIRSILRSSLPNRTTGILLSSAKRPTAARNAVPILSIIAGDGIG